MDLPTAISALIEPRHLTSEEITDVTTTIMQGKATPAQIGAFLLALRLKGETVEELVGAARVVRKFAAGVKVDAENVADTVGTGGDGAGLFNVSTASAFAAASVGVVIAKHGNRAVTGKSGSADLLESSGVNINLTPEQVAETIKSTGIGYMFAPAHHGAFRHLVGPRREIGVRTMFNLLGPLTNPADVKHQLVGVFDGRWVRPIAEVFRQLNSIHTLVIHSEDGLDEISIAAATKVSELRHGTVTNFVIKPEDFGIHRQPLESLVVDSVEASLDIIRRVFSGEKGPAYDMVAINAGATIYVADQSVSLRTGIERAREALDSGMALRKMEEMAKFTQKYNRDD